MRSARPRRLPGFRFETVAPPLPESLPRMDISVFVGFAAAGPINVPVAIESDAQFSAVFGSDAPLAWDLETGEQTFAHLPRSVRAFFRNGGRRCWVIRVARQVANASNQLNRARCNYFPIPGLVRVQFDRQAAASIPPNRAQVKRNRQLKPITPAFAKARSEGSWSDSLRVGSALLSQSFQLASNPALPHLQSASHDGDYVIELNRSPSEKIAVGDLFRLTFQNAPGRDRYVLFLAVEEVDQPVLSPAAISATVKVTASKGVWLELVNPGSIAPAGTELQVSAFGREVDSPLPADGDPAAHFRLARRAILNPSLLSPLTEDAPVIEANDLRVLLKLLDWPAADLPATGSVISIEHGSDTLWMTVAGQALGANQSSSFIWGQPFKEIDPPADVAGNPRCELLTFELWVRNGEEYSVSLSELGFDSRHERFWGALPSDYEVYEVDAVTLEPKPTVLWRQMGDLFRFPLAGRQSCPLSRAKEKVTGDRRTNFYYANDCTAAEDIPEASRVHFEKIEEAEAAGFARATREEMYFPLTMSPLTENFLGPVALQGSELHRDGLAEFDPFLFLDSGLISTTTEQLASEADYISYLMPHPRKLTGVHRALALEEPTIIAVPDAVHRGWIFRKPEPQPSPEPSKPEIRDDWWHFLDCWPAAAQKRPPLRDCEPEAPASSKKPLARPEWGNFLNCSIRVIDSPVLNSPPPPVDNDTFVLSWFSTAGQPATYELQESSNPKFSDAETIYRGQSTSLTVHGRRSGDYYYRVRALIASDFSDWSNGVAFRVASKQNWVTKKREDYAPDALLAIQRSLLRMCAARGDLLCVLSLPEHYREDDAIEHVKLIKATRNQPPPISQVSPLAFAEARDFSYGAIFHPWIIERDPPDAPILTRTPPCGTVTGLMADRAMRRRAWLAPANQPMRGVLALEPPIDPGRRLDLQDSQINLVRHEPIGFVVLDADTLSDDIDLRPINVRRLLILLRRQALRLGARYVFEPNSPAFRRMVERGFTEMLESMFESGAFAGSTAATSYQVVVDDSVNTRTSVEQGRFIVELRVAPALPMRFLTIRLIQSADRGDTREVR